MRINDYEFIDSEESEAGRQLRKLGHAHPLRTDRLVHALEEFVRSDAGLSSRVAGDEIEFYLVPPRYVLAHIPDAAALVQVDHERQQIEAVLILELYGGVDEPAQWEHIRRRAQQIIGEERSH